MIETETLTNPRVIDAVELWHKMIAHRDLSRLDEIVADDAVFFSPTTYRRFQSAEALKVALNTVITVFDDLKYHRHFAGNDGLSVILEFSAKVSDKELRGVDLIRFNERGKIVEFEVTVRPKSALQALFDEMNKKLGETMVGYKGA